MVEIDQFKDLRSDLPIGSLLGRLLVRETGVWSLWDGNIATLRSALRVSLEKEIEDRFESVGAMAVRSTTYEAARDQYGRVDTAILMLDRIGTQEDGDLFSSFAFRKTRTPNSVYPSALYAWGRRLPPDQRPRLAEIFVSTVEEYQCALNAFCESCPDSEILSIFGWLDMCEAAGRSRKIEWACDPIVSEYVRRVVSVEDRLSELLGVATSLIDSMQIESPWASAKESLFRKVCGQIVRDASSSVAPAAELPESEEAWLDWMKSTLKAGGQSRVISLLNNLSSLEQTKLAVVLWVEAHDSSNWEGLIENLNRLPQIGSDVVARRLERIIPVERIDCWSDLLRDSASGRNTLAAFCRWLKPDYRDVLLRIANQNSELDVAICAFQAYLHKCPEPVLREMWLFGRSRLLPHFQFALLDRFLFAPTGLKPLLIRVSEQEIDANPGLREVCPFSS